MKKSESLMKLLGVLVIGIVIGVIFCNSSIKNQNNSEANDTFILGSSKYYIEAFGNKCPYVNKGINDSDDLYCDQRILKEDQQTGAKRVVVKSVKEQFPALKSRWNNMIFVVAEPRQLAQKIFLVSALLNTNAGINGAYSFDSQSDELKKLKTSCFPQSKDDVKLSPDQTRIACVSGLDGGPYQKIVVHNLLTNENENVVNLPGKETLEGNPQEWGGHAEVVWINNNKIVYAVFDHGSKKSEKPLIEYRTEVVK
ncbi:MAG: hypothetical protein O3A36_04140 [bacterium]|nr:hypothetical protein [bacterium]